jgi:hypothetical protein
MDMEIHGREVDSGPVSCHFNHGLEPPEPFRKGLFNTWIFNEITIKMLLLSNPGYLGVPELICFLKL